MKYLKENKIETIKRYLDFMEYQVEPDQELKLDENSEDEQSSGVTVTSMEAQEGIHDIEPKTSEINR